MLLLVDLLLKMLVKVIRLMIFLLLTMKILMEQVCLLEFLELLEKLLVHIPLKLKVMSLLVNSLQVHLTTLLNRTQFMSLIIQLWMRQINSILLDNLKVLKRLLLINLDLGMMLKFHQQLLLMEMENLEHLVQL